MVLEKRYDPTSEYSRIDLLDIYRGFAIFGILVVNIEIMNCLIVNQGTFSEQWTSDIDIFSYRILQLFFYSKFFPIFSFLFGLGVGIQSFKSATNPEIPYFFLFKRMAILFVFGLLHICFLWSGDILHLYAMIGFLTLPFISMGEKSLLAISLVLFAFPFYEKFSEFIFNRSGFDFQHLIGQYTSQEIVDKIRNGTFSDQFYLRWADYLSNIPLLIGMLAPIALSMFLLGLYFTKKSYIYDLKALIFKIKNPILVILTLITAYRLFFIFSLTDLEIYRDTTLRPIFLKLIFLSDVLTGLFYLWFIGYIYHFTNFTRLFNPLKYVGKMALSNYILQSVIGLFVFYSIGFSLYESLSPAMTLLASVLIFTFQVLLSMLWFQYFRIGPLEWVWRTLSYGKTIRIRKVENKE